MSRSGLKWFFFFFGFGNHMNTIRVFIYKRVLRNIQFDEKRFHSVPK